MEKFPILLLMITLPLFSAFFIAGFVKQSRNPAKVLYAKYVTLLATVLTFISSCFMMINYDLKGGYQYQETYNIIPFIGLNIELGVDGISILFTFLTTTLTLICISISLISITKHVKEFLVSFLMLESFVLGAFCANNLMLFYICFEALLIPIFIIIGIWGGVDRIYSSFKLFLYTLFGSILFLLDIIYLYIMFGTLSIPEITKLSASLPLLHQCILWIPAFIAFGIKVPMFPFHTWLPDAHVQAPTSGSVILAGILLKVGTYGFIRVLLMMFPEASHYFAPFVIWLSVIAIIYGSVVAIGQTDMKKMIAYSSVAHMGYVTGGIFSFSSEGMIGAIFQMISHGVVSSGLFIVIGFLYERMHTKEISAYGGMSQSMPILAVFFLIFTLAAVGLPGTSGFIGEFYSLVGMYDASIYYSIFGGLGMILSAVYMLRLYRDVMYGEVKNHHILECRDLSAREIWSLVPLAACVIILGIFPGLITQYFEHDVAQILISTGGSL
ncbi:MAG: NADH-quinone oxidoreductase subunit M [Rickettsiaceae bacterium]|nr:NADH-quinone oxidoreductase subunit M [Rickettsiaceae bacterium]